MRLTMRLLPFLLLAVLLPASAAQPITVSPVKPVAGQEATIQFDAPVDSLFVIFRPGAAVDSRDTVFVGGRSELRRAFERAGVVRLTAIRASGERVSQNVSVRFREIPVRGILVLSLAGLILFGGAAFAMASLLREEPPRPGGA